MRLSSLVSQVALFASVLSLSGAALAGDADFTLVNRTGYDISEVYISPANKNNWGRDRLGRNRSGTRLFGACG